MLITTSTQQEPNGTEPCHRPSASLRAPSGKLAAHNTVTIHILRASYSVLPSLKQLSFLKTGGHPNLQIQHPLQDTKNSWTMTWSARWGIHTWPTFKSSIAQTCRQETKTFKMFQAQSVMVFQIASYHNYNSINVFRTLLQRWNWKQYKYAKEFIIVVIFIVTNIVDQSRSWLSELDQSVYAA